MFYDAWKERDGRFETSIFLSPVLCLIPALCLILLLTGCDVRSGKESVKGSGAAEKTGVTQSADAGMTKTTVTRILIPDRSIPTSRLETSLSSSSRPVSVSESAAEAAPQQTTTRSQDAFASDETEIPGGSADSASSEEGRILEDLGNISEAFFNEINEGRRLASLEPMQRDEVLDRTAGRSLDRSYATVEFDRLQDIPVEEGYLFYSGSGIQLSETEVLDRLVNIFNNNGSLRAGLYDARFTRAGIATRLSVRPDSVPTYIYLCYIAPTGEPIAPTEPEDTSGETVLESSDETAASAEVPDETTVTGAVTGIPSGTESGGTIEPLPETEETTPGVSRAEGAVASSRNRTAISGGKPKAAERERPL